MSADDLWADFRRTPLSQHIASFDEEELTPDLLRTMSPSMLAMSASGTPSLRKAARPISKVRMISIALDSSCSSLAALLA